MKPRFPSIALTLEDFEIWDRLSEPRFQESMPFGDGVPLLIYVDAHDRDADLMFQAQRHPLISGHITGSGEHVMLRSNLTSYRRAGVL